MFTERDLQLFQRKGISTNQVEKQLAIFTYSLWGAIRLFIPGLNKIIAVSLGLISGECSMPKSFDPFLFLKTTGMIFDFIVYLATL